MTEEELRLLISRSQKDGFKALFQQYQNYVYSIIWGCIRKTGSLQDAEECMSDVFADVFLNFDKIHTGSLQAYIGTVAKRKAVDRFRRLNSDKSIPSENEEMEKIPNDTDIEREFEISERNRILYETIHLLGEPDASLIIQKYYYERKSSDIAKSAGMTPVAVRVRLKRALKRLSKLLKNENIY